MFRYVEVEYNSAMSPKSVTNSTSQDFHENAEDIIYSKLVKCEPGEEIIITGISGVYPKADNIRQLGEKLWSKEDMVSEVSCQEVDGLSPASRYGKINEERIRKFDASFFKISMYGADAIDPQSRILLELAYEAVMDAGYNPESFRGTKTGVFVGLYRSDSTESWIYEKNSSEGHGFYGNVRSMIASRISFAMGLTGPVIAVDGACASSLTALDCAIKNIRTGVCEAAIVAGCNLLLNWQTIHRWYAMGMVSPVGKSQTFSETADGYCRSESIVALLIQKKKDARRLYAEVVHLKMNNNGDKGGAIEKTSDVSQIELLQEFYAECRIDPTTLNYVELHGTGTRVGDLMEANALEKVFCGSKRRVPLKVGSIRSNMGHSEAVSGLCSISKAILMFEREMIPPNLHFYEPRSDIAALKDGRIQVVTDLEPFFDNLIAVSNLGYGGTNGHALLRNNIKHKINGSKPTDNLPRLVVASSRTEKAIQKIFNELIGKLIDSEFVRLLHATFAENIPNHNYRGYIVLNTLGVQKTKQIEKFSGEKRPVWFIFRGMGSQYPKMGRALLNLPITRESIHKSHEILKKKGLDLIEIITKDDPKLFDNILHSFVGIAAIQIALVDLLKAIGINPDGMIGHSVGELGCAYADNCFSAEQMILAAYYRGKVSNDTNLEPGYMAAVVMPHDELKALLPHDIDIACHNAPNNYSVSGPQESIKKFIASLDKDGIFARQFNVSNIAFHSRYIEPAASELLSAMKMVVPDQTLRSKKWICSSVPEAEWSSSETRNSCAEYYVNSLKNCVYFEEACRHIPNDAITVEISPHGFFQSLVKQSPNLQITNVPLLSRNAANDIDFLFSALGRLYNLGVNAKVGLHKIYPAISFPVSRGTPMISPLIEWNHDNDYFVTKHFLEVQKAAEQTITVSLDNPEWEFISGHVVDGRVLFPGVGYIYLAWKSFSKTEAIDYTRNSVVIENLELKRAVILTKQDKVEFTVNIQRGCGSFEIIESDTVVAFGKIRKMEKTKITDDDMKMIETDIVDKTEYHISTEDIYKDFRLKGYKYKRQFIGITKATYDGSTARVKWEDNYITFLDTLIQIFLLSIDSQHLLVPTGIDKITINTELHNEYLNRLNTKYPEFVTYYDKQLSTCKSVGVEIKRVSFNKLQRKPLSEPVTLQKIEFLPFAMSKKYSLYEALITSSEIIKRNINSTMVQTLELVHSTDPNFTLISPIINEILDLIPQMKVEMSVMIESNDLRLRSKSITKPNIKITKMKMVDNEQYILMITSNLVTQKDKKKCQFCLDTLLEDGFLLLRETNEAIIDECILNQFEVCLDYKLETERILLCRRKKKFDKDVRAIRISHDCFDWIQTAKSALKEIMGCKNKRIILYTENDDLNGILGLSYCLFKEYGIQNLRCYFIADKSAPPFSTNDPFYKSQISKDLIANIYKHGSWGTFCDFLLNKKLKIEAPHAELQLRVPGDVSSLNLVEGPLDPLNFKPTHDKTLLHVYYSELNFRDVLLASAKLSTAVLSADDCPETPRLGFGCSGKTADGKRYMTIAKSGCFATLLDQDSNLMIPVPDQWTLEEAATVPIVYLTVIYSFFKTERLHRGDSILIHSGTGGVGQAAIHICLHYGCTIFTTVGSPGKRDFIRKTFPSIPESHIGNSRDLSFENMIMKETNGRGVDVVLNSLSEEKLLASVKCLAVGGRFIEIGLYDFLENNPLHMRCFLKEISFHPIQLLNLIEASETEKKRFINLMVEHINNGAIKPLNHTVFDLEDAEAAFRYMGSGKHVGKVLLRIRQEETDIYSAPKPLSLPAVPNFFCSDSKSYIVCGGLGGLGLELIEWLILRGARNLVISSRRGLTTGYQSWKIQKWKSRGAKIIIVTDDITKEEGVRNLLEVANALNPVVAIFNLAMILKDALFENQTENSFLECAGPKVAATINLDNLSRKMCPQLEYFVVFSSVSCGFGNMGQTNYGMANSVMERICEKRKSENLPATAIQWGPMADVGAVVEALENPIALEGLTEQPVHSFLHEMNFLLRQPNAVVRSIILNKIQSTNAAEKNIFDIIGKIFGLKEMDKLDPKTKLTDYGMDSITSIELKQILEREFDIITSMKDIKEITIGRILELQNATKMNEDSTSLKTSGKEQKAYVKLARHSFEILANQIPAEVKREEWQIVQRKSVDKNGSKDSSTVFVFPGFEGYSEFMKNATIHINANIYTIQYSSEVEENFQQTVKELASHISDILTANKNYTFIAYSFGCAVAIEVLRILECQKKIGRLFLMDVDLIAGCSIATKLETTDQIMNEIIFQFLPVFWPKYPRSLLEDVKNLPNWISKVKSIVSQIPADSTYTVKQLTYSLNLLYQRIMMVREWEFTTEQTLASSTIIMRPKVNLFEKNIHYDISKHFSSPVDIQDVDGNHFTMLKNVSALNFERRIQKDESI